MLNHLCYSIDLLMHCDCHLCLMCFDDDDPCTVLDHGGSGSHDVFYIVYDHHRVCNIAA